MHLSLLSFHVFSLEHKASKITACSNLFLNNMYQQPCSLPSLEKTELSEQNIKMNSFLIWVFRIITSLVSAFWPALDTGVGGRWEGSELAHRGS